MDDDTTPNVERWSVPVALKEIFGGTVAMESDEIVADVGINVPPLARPPTSLTAPWRGTGMGSRPLRSACNAAVEKVDDVAGTVIVDSDTGDGGNGFATPRKKSPPPGVTDVGSRRRTDIRPAGVGDSAGNVIDATVEPVTVAVPVTERLALDEPGGGLNTVPVNGGALVG